MNTPSISYKRHRFPPEILAHAVWLYCRFNMSLREVQELLLELGIDVSHETIRRWVAKFGPAIARGLRRRQPQPGDIWHLDDALPGRLLRSNRREGRRGDRRPRILAVACGRSEWGVFGRNTPVPTQHKGSETPVCTIDEEAQLHAQTLYHQQTKILWRCQTRDCSGRRAPVS